MASKKYHHSVYAGDIHGARLSIMRAALKDLEIKPQRFLCTMDTDQVLSIMDVQRMDDELLGAGMEAVIVPGNHEDAIVFGIQIGSATYRKNRQNTNIAELTEDMERPEFAGYLAYVKEKLRIKGGLRCFLDANGAYPSIIIHGALSGKQEKYLHEFEEALQEHVKDRSDLWLRLEDHSHIRQNFTSMAALGIQCMVRGHDHYVAVRSEDQEGKQTSYEVVCQSLPLNTDAYAIIPIREHDEPDHREQVQADKLAESKSHGELHWHPLQPDHKYVINFGPYYDGNFGLVRSSRDEDPPEIAFCRVEPSFYTADDRMEHLAGVSKVRKSQVGKTFYELFPTKK